eukprot:PhM_4_TR584/c1_g1_i1/m.86360/K00457/HPD, hppD; 4-hydroxyphenylpyruvate dioxygenase
MSDGKTGGSGRSDKRLVGCANFVKHNPMSDRFEMECFDHIDIWTADAQNTAGRFAVSLGMVPEALSDLTTGNQKYSSYVLKSNQMVFIVTAPYFTHSPPPAKVQTTLTYPDLNRQEMLDFINKHGMGVRAVGIRVKDATKAFEESVKNGAVAAQPPLHIEDEFGKAVISEIVYYKDVRLRFVQREGYTGPFLPGYSAWPETKLPRDYNYGIERIDHIVSNVPDLAEVVDYAMKATGLHEFGEFVAADVGTVDSGLNSMILSNNAETVLMPVNEPTFGTRRKSQIQSFLEHHQGPGIQHIAILTYDIFSTIEKMQSLPPLCGMEFMPAPGGDYYEKHVPEKMKGLVDQDTIDKCRKLGILIDRDEEGGLLQIFTKPVLDRPTLFFEVIQRVGCTLPEGKQKPACGGFGKGNFGALFKSIEDWEKQLDGEVTETK